MGNHGNGRKAINQMIGINDSSTKRVIRVIKAMEAEYQEDNSIAQNVKIGEKLKSMRGPMRA